MNARLDSLTREADRLELTLVAVAVFDQHETLPDGGLAVVRRARYPFEGRDHAFLRWAARDDGSAYFYSGHYDVTRDDALGELLGRIAQEAPGERVASAALDSASPTSP